MDNGDGAKSQCDYFAIIRSYCCCCCCCCPCAVLLATFGHISDNDETGELPAQAKQAGYPDPLPLLCACWHYIVAVVVVAASGCSWLLLLPDLSAILKVIKIARKSLTSGTNTRSRAQLDRTAPTQPFPSHCSRPSFPPPTHHICLFSELPKQQQQ